MIRQNTAYYLTCDECDKTYETEFGHIKFFERKLEVIESAESDGWKIVRNGYCNCESALCPSCKNNKP